MKAGTKSYIFLLLVVLGQMFGAANAQTFYTDGPIELYVRAGYVYVNQYHDFFGGNQGKPFAQIKSHLMTKHRARARSGSVTTVRTVLKNVGKKVEILLHWGSVARLWRFAIGLNPVDHRQHSIERGSAQARAALG